jgi:hypothetical protein
MVTYCTVCTEEEYGGGREEMVNASAGSPVISMQSRSRLCKGTVSRDWIGPCIVLMDRSYVA